MKQQTKKIYPPTIFYTLVFLNMIVFLIFPTPYFSSYLIRLIGIIPVCIGILLNLWTNQTLNKYHTTVKPDEIPSTLIMDGPFSLSRHPMYLGMELILFGIAIILGSLSCLILPIVFLILIEKMFISYEEKTLQTWFSEEYTNYIKKVRKWI